MKYSFSIRYIYALACEVERLRGSYPQIKNPVEIICNTATYLKFGKDNKSFNDTLRGEIEKELNRRKQ